MRWSAPVAALAFGALGASMFAMGSFVFGGAALAAAALTLRPTLMSQALARAAVWSTLLPNALVTLLLIPMGHAPPLRVVLQMALAAFALVVARPLLATARARAEFAPLALRPWFLASAIGALASGITLAMLAQSFAHFPVLLRETVGLAMLAVPLVATGIGVLRMRTWGVVLGVLTALASIPIALWMRDLRFAIMLATAPGALMGALVVAARARVGYAEPARARIAPIVRVSVPDDDVETDDAGDIDAQHYRVGMKKHSC